MFIDNSSALEANCPKVSGCPYCAVDVEFVRRSTYAPIVSLVQLAARQDNPLLVDTLAFNEAQPLVDLMENEECLKVFHSCSQDFEALSVYCGALPKNCIDTQIGAAFSGLGYQIGFATLVEESLGMILDKDMQTSDWNRRPLTERQIAYAERDVTILLESFVWLRNRLKELGRWEWVMTECNETMTGYLERQAELRISPARVRGSGRMSPREYTILAHLLRWREDLARRQNRPTRWMLPNPAILELAFAKPQNYDQIQKLDKLSHKQKRQYAQEVLECVHAGMNTPKDELLSPPRATAPSKAERKLMKAVSECISRIADESGVAQELIAPQRDVSSLVRKRNYDESPILNGWRRELVGADVLKVLEPA